MAYTPIDFKDLPSEDTPINASNLNYMQQGIVSAVDMATTLDSAWERGDLNGKDGLQGEKGEDGKSFQIDGYAEMLDQLPTPSEEYKNQIWVTYQYGHLHYCDGTQWIDWGQFVGVKGDKGDSGDFDISKLTDDDLDTLSDKLSPFSNNPTWGYETNIATGQSARFQVADLNLDLYISRSGSTITYSFYPNDTSKPSTYYVRRLSNYDATAWECTYTSNYQPQAITASGFTLDGSGYLPGREYTQIQVIDPNEDFWYSFWFTGQGNGVMYVDVVKRHAKGRIVVSAS